MAQDFRRFSRIGPILCLIVLLMAGGKASATDRILFIGNSLTYANNLPAMVCALAAASGKQLQCEAVAKPAYSLEDHWNDGAALKKIREGGWTWVVLQQGPSGAIESRRSLLLMAGRFDREIRKRGGTSVVYQVWPAMERSRDFDRVLESYRLAAVETKGQLVPAGTAMREAVGLNVEVFQSDEFHPSVTGSYLAALVFYRALYGEDPKTDVIGFDGETRRKMTRCVEAAFP